MSVTSQRTVLHEGELWMQDHAGLDAENRKFIQSILRPYMPDQHRIFFSNQPYLIVGSRNDSGEVWASIMFGPRGFVSSPEPTILQISPALTPGDPLETSIRDGSPVGLLGIEFDTRRRNRMNGKIRNLDRNSGTFQVSVDLSFGNCPKYIQARELTYLPGLNSLSSIRDWSSSHTKSSPIQCSPLPQLEADMIRRSDAFFVASSFGASPSDPSHGVDVSHRGGLPGFVQVSADSTEIVWPDYLGNFFFNTLGNIHQNPNCGLLFIDFEANRILQVVGKGQIVHDVGTPALGAQRYVRFSIEKWRSVEFALPFSWRFISTSPYCPAISLSGAPAGTNPRTGLMGIPVSVREIIYETRDTATYILGGAGIALTSTQIPGQYASFVIDTSDEDSMDDNESDSALPDSDQIRTWTISSAPNGPSDYSFAITVRRKPGGSISNLLFEGKVSKMLLTGIGGTFHLPPGPPARPLLFLAAGVGITPLMSMLRGLAKSGYLESQVNLDFVLSFQTAADIIFVNELSAFAEQFPSAIRISIFLTRQAEVDRKNPTLRNFGLFVGERISSSRLSMVVPDIQTRDVYLCGPSQFMESLENELVSQQGVPITQVHSEGFNY
eukprot:TRINITY_DN3508_c0_g1_i1.p1 TRINITY_DN3508_c0_g1~~TRINITY_DN3508_c0_g1_i1.p1  ORF type:complete len:610 (-),score=74.64 TRINITY_DN3508_c0_g1_i1:62-1891(-)